MWSIYKLNSELAAARTWVDGRVFLEKDRKDHAYDCLKTGKTASAPPTQLRQWRAGVKTSNLLSEVRTDLIVNSPRSQSR